MSRVSPRARGKLSPLRREGPHVKRGDTEGRGPAGSSSQFREKRVPDSGHPNPNRNAWQAAGPRGVQQGDSVTKTTRCRAEAAVTAPRATPGTQQALGMDP